MKIALGQTVWTTDRQKIGVVDRLLVHATDRQVEHLVVHKGLLLDHDKLVPKALIERVDGDGVTLGIDSEAARQLATFDHRYSSRDPETAYPEAVPGPYQSMILFSTPAPGQMYLDRGHLFRLEHPTDADQNREAEMPDAEIILGKGAEVIDSTGHVIGSLQSLEYDADGRLAQIVVQTGLVRHHEVTISSTHIASLADEEIALSVTSDEAIQRS